MGIRVCIVEEMGLSLHLEEWIGFLWWNLGTWQSTGGSHVGNQWWWKMMVTLKNDRVIYLGHQMRQRGRESEFGMLRKWRGHLWTWEWCWVLNIMKNLNLGRLKVFQQGLGQICGLGGGDTVRRRLWNHDHSRCIGMREYEEVKSRRQMGKP